MEQIDKDEKTSSDIRVPENSQVNEIVSNKNDNSDLTTAMQSLDVTEVKMVSDLEKENKRLDQEHEIVAQVEGSNEVKLESRDVNSQDLKEKDQVMEEFPAEEKEADPVFDGTELPDQEARLDMSTQSPDVQSEEQANAWPDRAVALKNYVKEKGVAVATVLRRLSGKREDDAFSNEEEKIDNAPTAENGNEIISGEETTKESPEKSADRATWNPLKFMKFGRDVGHINPDPLDQANIDSPTKEQKMKGRVVLFTKLGCQDSKFVRSILHQKGLKYVEINIDIFPSRKLELENRTGSSEVPRLYFNDILVGGLSELQSMGESGELEEKIKYLFNEELSVAAPLPPLPGEDDETGSGKVDELASVVRKMKESIIPKDRFYKMRRFSRCFLGSEVVDFLAEDQYLEREEAVEFAMKLANQHFFRHVLDENVFEDGSHLYRFLEHDPTVMSQCHNIPKGILDVQPKPVTEIALRLRFLSYAVFEAYVSEDGRHVDYTSISASEEFKRYLRTIEELQRVDMDSLSREEKLTFFLNLYNMMAIHAILTGGYPVGALDRRKFLGDFKYVIGGCTYSLSAIHNGILRGNRRPPYNLSKPFGPKDRRSKVALPYVEPLVHFALVSGNKSGPALRCYSPGNIDKELMEAARDFTRNGGLSVDTESKTASVNKNLKWYSTDFGKNEVEVLKHAANYLEPAKSEQLLELLATTQLKVVYQPYNWGQNC